MLPGAGKIRFRFEGKVWSQRAPGLTFFVSLPKDISAEILDIAGNDLNPWGTVPVEATVNDYTWESAMFPRKDRACYDLPLNAKTRKRLALADGDHIAVTIDISLPA